MINDSNNFTFGIDIKQMNATTNKLDAAYNAEQFRNTGHELIDVLANHLKAVQNNSGKVIDYKTPKDELAFWQQNFDSTEPPIQFFKNVIQHSINVHHPKFMGHQVAVPALLSGLSGLLSDVLANGTGVYEMGMASNAIEKIVADFMAQSIGYDKSSCGHLTSGGTLANLTAMLAARKAKAPTNVWVNGHKERLAIMVSAEAHYCIDRAARIMGLGDAGILKIPVDKNYKIRIDLLEDHLKQATQKGLKVIAIVGSACSTATGSYDDLKALAKFANQQNLWFHVDGAHGGAAVFSAKYKHLVEGIEMADSVVIDFHKMLMTPALTTALIFKNGEDSYQTFQQQANYLWQDSNTHEWYNSSKRTFECTKLMMSIKIFTLIKTYGIGLFEENVNRLYDLGKNFATIIKKDKAFELAIEPETNIVNFRYVKGASKDLNWLNQTIRQQIIDDGSFYIVQTTLNSKVYFRTSLMNPLTSIKDFTDLLEKIKALANKF